MAIDPDHLLEQAEQLINVVRGAPRQTDLRRAVSNSYYALFHTFTATAADTFIGKSYYNEKRYTDVYRALNHGFAKEKCKKYAAQSKTGDALEKIASAFVQLQEARHKADYAPNENFSLTEAKDYIDLATKSIGSWKRVHKDKRTDFLVRLFFNSRK